MPLNSDNVLQKLLDLQAVHGRHRPFQNVVFHLATLILAKRDFSSLQALIEFCRDPDNLSEWLPSRRDRETFSESLVTSLPAAG